MLKNSKQILLTLLVFVIAGIATGLTMRHLNQPEPQTEYCGCKFWVNFNQHPTVTTYNCEMVGPYLKVGEYYYKTTKWKRIKCTGH